MSKASDTIGWSGLIIRGQVTKMMMLTSLPLLPPHCHQPRYPVQKLTIRWWLLWSVSPAKSSAISGTGMPASIRLTTSPRQACLTAWPFLDPAVCFSSQKMVTRTATFKPREQCENCDLWPRSLACLHTDLWPSISCCCRQVILFDHNLELGPNLQPQPGLLACGGRSCQ